jgi:hypothetical protein
VALVLETRGPSVVINGVPERREESPGSEAVSEDFQLLDYPEPVLSKRCVQCQFVYGRERPENVSLLRCPNCDYPLHESKDAFRAIAMALQETPTNVYSTVACYVWLYLVRDGVDLAVEPYLGADDFGTVPEWFDYEIGNCGWDGIISPDYKSWRSDESPSDFDGTWNNWGLEQGVCPGQPFLVEMKHPHYYKCGGYEYPEEVDVEYYWDIVMRAPYSAKQAARIWVQWQKKCADNCQVMQRAAARLRRRRARNVEAMFIQHDSFWADRYDEMTAPDGVIVRLCSNFGHYGTLAEGRSGRKRDEERTDAQERAWNDLLANVREHLPHLDLDVVRKLPTRW